MNPLDVTSRKDSSAIKGVEGHSKSDMMGVGDWHAFYLIGLMFGLLVQ
jgi:hypothetical protein